MKLPKRIYIVGGQGSGKTTLANLLARKLQYQHIDLDTIRQPGDNTTKRTISERLPLIKEIAKKDTWIAEGIYVSWVKEILERADQIIFLDMPYSSTIPRVVLRYIKRKLTGNDKYGFLNEISLVTDIYRYHFPKPGFETNDEDRYITREKTVVALKPYMEKVIFLKSEKEVQHYLQELK